jgi:hypothetical protein
MEGEQIHLGRANPTVEEFLCIRQITKLDHRQPSKTFETSGWFWLRHSGDSLTRIQVMRPIAAWYFVSLVRIENRQRDSDGRPN